MVIGSLDINIKSFRFKGKPDKIKVTIPKRKNPEATDPRIKYLRLASELLISLLLFPIRIKIENVCNSRLKYIIKRLSATISIIDPINTKTNRI